jgi:hypothetical protein
VPVTPHAADLQDVGDLAGDVHRDVDPAAFGRDLTFPLPPFVPKSRRQALFRFFLKRSS